ncbi:hypothetical protein HY495_00580 [Candidatus Woesearchaeota archaeon]|nr:hypothetical protein [Candidatus Woesearchaeota archaeon]
MKQITSRATTNKKQNDSSVNNSSVKRRNSSLSKGLSVRLAVVIGILILIVLGGLWYQFASVGKAVEAPLPTAVDLDLQASEEINIENVPTIQIKVTRSDAKSSAEYSLDLTVNDDESSYPSFSSSYVLKDSTKTILAQELLNDLSSGKEIYLPGDEHPDLLISYAAPYLKIANLNYISPEAVKITVFDSAEKVVSSPFLSLTDGKAHFVFNATSSAAPTLTAQWADGTPLDEGVFVVTMPTEMPVEIPEEGAPSTKATLATLDWSQEQDGAYPFVVVGKVGDQQTVKRYVLSVGGILYDLDKTNLPAVSVKQLDANTIAVTYTFVETTDPQPFSLPCGKLELVDGTISDDLKAKIDIISSYGGGIKQWKKDVPSNFKELQSNKGYFLQRKTASGDLSFTVQCKSSKNILPPDSTPLFSLPVLNKGWNLIGISGYESVAVEKLETSLPPYTAISALYSLTGQGADTSTPVSELEPGRAYWVRVQ